MTVKGNDEFSANQLATAVAPEERDWVQRMIECGLGKTSDDIKNLSPHLQPYDENGEKMVTQIPRRTEQNPDAAAITQVQAILSSARDLVDRFWVGDSQAQGQSVQAFDLVNMPMTGVKLHPLPKFIIPNALTDDAGETKNSEESLPCDSTVKSARLMVIKFDALTEEEQTAFWCGVLETDVFRIVSLVSSGDKTIHALVEVEGEYGAFRERVLRLCCSAENAQYRCDATLLHPSAPTCLAGARCLTTGRYQELLFARGSK